MSERSQDTGPPEPSASQPSLGSQPEPPGPPAPPDPPGPPAPPDPPTPLDLGSLADRIELLGPADRRRLGRRLAQTSPGRSAGGRGSSQRGRSRRGRAPADDGSRPAADLGGLAASVASAEARVQRRRAGVPPLTFPPQLPVSDRLDDLSAAIRDHQVVIVAGETGSGKSTQLPKICLRLGRGIGGMIGHTQPRRIAARALAERIAEETGTSVGGLVGYTVRFGDHTGPDTLVKLMTDGILLAEINRDRDLLAYDTIIVDEAHERSLTIDFLLGYLVELLPRRPDLKVIITSATIDPQRFSRHFGGAPVVEVSGRTYPVEIRYRPYGPAAEDGADEADGADDADDDRDTGNQRRRPAGRHQALAATRTRAPAATRAQGGGAEVDQTQAIVTAVDELSRAGDGDILVFLSGEREITDTADALRGHLESRRSTTEILPLYGRLSAADQHRVFSEHSGRRIVLSTNVAETSLTVPGIRYVIDPGTARISRYSVRTKVQRLPIERISQASAGQRAGRCGRVADGICIRLYSEDDFLSRPEFTDPEIIRTSLAAVILQMAALELGDVASFPFLDPPETRQISDGIAVLTELGALEPGRGGPVRLTPIGRRLADLPLDPRLARMIVEGERRGCGDEITVIAAALAVQDVREYPLEERDKATAAHSRFVDPTSDFLALLNLWHYLREQGAARSGNAFRRMCRSEYLHYLRIREWQDLHAQLRQLLRSSRRDHPGRETAPSARSAVQEPDQPAAQPVSPAPAAQQGRGSLAADGIDTVAVHTALLAGLLSHLGRQVQRDRKVVAALAKSGVSREYEGARGTSFVLWPGSALAKSPPELVVAAELVETARLWGRTAAAVDPRWVEDVGADAVKRSYSEPRWDSRRAAVMATEKVTLFGVTVVAARSVNYDRIDPQLSRELFIRHALVERDWETRHPFFAANERAMQEVSEREDRIRRRDLLLDDESLFALYDERIPADVTSGRHFDSWWRRQSRETPNLLTFSPDMLVAADAADVDITAYPDRLTAGGLQLDLDYVFDPARVDDGISTTLPLASLAELDPEQVDVQIPAVRADLAVALIRSLPKSLRRNFVPAPDVAAQALRGISGTAPLAPVLAAELTRMTGIAVTAADFEPDKVPDHLRMTYRIVDESGREVAVGKDLAALRRSLAQQTRGAVAALTTGVERRGLTDFPADGIPPQVSGRPGGQRVTGYPALVDDGASVSVRVMATPVEQARAMRAGTRRLLAMRLRPPVAHVRNGFDRSQQLTFTVSPFADLGPVLVDSTEAAIDALLDWAGGPSYTAAGFAAVASRIEPQLPRAVLDIMTVVEVALRAAQDAGAAIDDAAASPAAAGWSAQLADMRAQLRAMLGPGFVTRTSAARLPELARRLQALAIRARRLRESPARDLQRMTEIRALEDQAATVIGSLPPDRDADGAVTDLRRLLAEYRITLFAQPMKASVSVSAERIEAAIGRVRQLAAG